MAIEVAIGVQEGANTHRERDSYTVKKPIIIPIGVSKNRGTRKRMVNIMENPIKMDDLGGTTIFGNIHMF